MISLLDWWWREHGLYFPLAVLIWLSPKVPHVNLQLGFTCTHDDFDLLTGYKELHCWIVSMVDGYNRQTFQFFVKAYLQIDFLVKVTAWLDNLVSIVSSFHTKYMAGINFQCQINSLTTTIKSTKGLDN